MADACALDLLPEDILADIVCPDRRAWHALALAYPRFGRYTLDVEVQCDARWRIRPTWAEKRFIHVYGTVWTIGAPFNARGGGVCCGGRCLRGRIGCRARW